MKLLYASQMREMDRYTIDVLGVPSTLLMTNAAEQVAKAAMAFTQPGGTAAVFCGSGNNGGDGIAAASYLIKKGVTVRAFLTGQREKMTPDAAEMERRLEEDGGILEPFASGDVERYLSGCDVVVDAMFGIGLNSALRGDALDAVRLINACPAGIVAADIPSGVDADTGMILGDAVRADVTVTFAHANIGHYAEPGCICCGRVRVADIGIPPELIDDVPVGCLAVADGDITLPRRRRDTHKGDYGRALIVAGSAGYSGAPVLAARAASAAGAGLVSLGVPESIYAIAAVKCDEEMVFSLPGTLGGALGAPAIDVIAERLKTADVCLLGPGLGRSEPVEAIVRDVVRASRVPLILDADGINALRGNIDILDEAACPVILTPHPGEFKRIGGDLSQDRVTAAREFALGHRCILVLKGHRTVTAMPDGTVFINTTGGPAMAKGGTGDVLAGMITALAGQKFPLKDAVLAAVYLHGLSGNLCAAAMGDYSVTATDIIAALPEAFKQVTE